MRIDLALLGDYALVDKMDKLTVAGIFRAVVGATLPMRHGKMFLALAMTAESGDGPHHTIAVRLIDPDGQAVIPELRAEIDVHRTDPGSTDVLNLVLELNGVEFKVRGTHCFDIFVDDRFVERVPLEVVQAKITGIGPGAEH